LIDKLNNLINFKRYKIRWNPRDKYIKLGCVYVGCSFKVWYSFKLDKSGRPCHIVRNKVMRNFHLVKAHEKHKVKQQSVAILADKKITLENTEI
jgi:hypothetical protein